MRLEDELEADKVRDPAKVVAEELVDAWADRNADRNACGGEKRSAGCAQQTGGWPPPRRAGASDGNPSRDAPLLRSP